MYRIEVEDSSGNRESIDSYTKLIYAGSLNGTWYFDIIIENKVSTDLTKFSKGYNVYVYRNDSLDFKGIIDKRTIKSNMLRIQGLGYVEKKLTDAKAESKSSWTSLDTNGIIGDIVARSNITANVVDNKTINAFRTQSNESCLSAIARFCETVNQDYSPDYTNNKIVIENHHGASTSQKTFNDGLDITNFTKVEDDRKKIKKVTVIGEGEGANQIIGSYSSGFTQGDNEITIIDRTITNTTDANTRAQLEYDIRSQTSYTYTFSVLDLSYNFTIGDVITIYSDSTDTNDDVRIVSFKRTVTEDSENLYLEVRGTTEREASVDRLKQYSLQKRINDNSITMKQTSDNSTANVYDPGHDHSDGSYAGVSHTHDAGSYSATSHTHATGTYGADKHGASDAGYFFGNYSDDLTGDDTWRSVGTSINTGSSSMLFHGIWGCFNIDIDFGSGASVPCSVYVRAKNTTTATYWPDSSGILISDGWTGQNTQNRMLTFYIHIPMNWSNINYLLQYKIQNENYWTKPTGNYQVKYSYHGSEGHTHTISGSSGSTTPGITGASGSTAPDVTGTSGITVANVKDSGHKH